MTVRAYHQSCMEHRHRHLVFTLYRSNVLIDIFTSPSDMSIMLNQ